MTMDKTVSAPSARQVEWDSIDWDLAAHHVRRLQMRIAKAVRDKNKGRVKSLQRILTQSFYAKALAVKRVTENRAAKTPGIDWVTLTTKRLKVEAIARLKRRG